MNGKLIKMLLAGVVTVGLAGCKGEMDAIEKEIKKVEVVDTSKVELNNEPSAVYISTTEKKITDNENISATFKGIAKQINNTSGYEYYEITFDVTNKRKGTITVIGNELSSNGKMINDNFVQMSQDISSGKKADTVVTVRNYEGGPLPKIEKDFEMILYISDKKSFDWSEEYKINVSF